MASWTYQKPSFSGRNSVGVAVSVGVHVVVIVLALTLRTPQNDSQPTPIAVRTLSSPMPQEQTLQPVDQPKRLERSSLTVPQPDFDVAAATPVASTAASVVTTENAAPTTSLTLPQFDADYLNNPAPKYPPLSRRLREEGVVLVRVYVLPNGLPEQIELKRSSGSSRLDHSALEAVRKWRFVPARRGNDTVAAWVVVPVEFNLTA